MTEENKEIKRATDFYEGDVPLSVKLEAMNRNAKGIKVEETTPVVEALKPKTTRRRKKKAPTKPSTPRKSSKKNKAHEFALRILGIGAAIITVLAVLRTGYIQFEYFNRDSGWLVAGVMAAIIGLVTVITPSAAIKAFQTKRYALGVLATVTALGFGYIAASITISELEESRTTSVTQLTDEQEAVLKARGEVESIDSRLIPMNESLVELRQERALKVQAISEVDARNAVWLHNKLTNEKVVIDEAIASKEAEIKSLEDRKVVLTNTDGYYTMVIVEEVSKADDLDAPLAIGLEVIGPIMLILALFL